MADKITVKIIDGYAFEHDTFGYVLFETGTRQKVSCFGREAAEGEMVEYKDTLGYFSSLPAVLESCMKHATRKATENAGVKNLGDYIEIMRQISGEIKSFAETTAF